MKARGERGNSGWDDWMALMDMSLSKLLETVKDREAWHAAVLWVTKSQTGLGTEQQENMPTSMDNLAVPNVT